MRAIHRFLASLLVATLITCATGGCTIFLPKKACLLYEGDVLNAHGFGEVGHGGDLYRRNGVAFVFNPIAWIDKQSFPGSPDVLITASDRRISSSSDAGLTLVLRCPKPQPTIATYTTQDGTLTAWLIRDDEYRGGPTTAPSAYEKLEPLNYEPLLNPAAQSAPRQAPTRSPAASDQWR